MYYQNKNNGKVARLVMEEEKGHTVMLEFVEDKKTTSISSSTFKRWYKKMDDYVEVEAVDTEVINEVNETVDVPILVKKSKRAVIPARDFTDVLDYINEVANTCDMEYVVREKQPYLRNYRFRSGGPGPMCVHIYKKKIEIHTKARLLPSDVSDAMISVNHCLNRKYIITDLTEDVKSFITTIISNIKK